MIHRLGVRINPFEVFFFVACLFQGALILTRQQPPASVSTVLPSWSQYVWGIFLVAGGVFALIGVLWPRISNTTPYIEQIGLGAVGAGCLFYSGSILYFTGRHHILLQGTYSASFVIAFGLACAWRYAQIERSIVALRSQGEG
jgi:uncharacterized membrane protein HdeD (DUF308 family)